MINLFCIRPKGFNVGNDVIFMGLQHFIYDAFGEVVNLISLPATSRYESQAKAGLTTKTIYEINQYGHGVIIGGGNLYENGELDVNLDALPTLEVPLMLFSLSRGRVYNRQNKLVDRTDTMPDRVLQALHRKASYSLARDEATLSYLHKIGCEGAELGGCPTIFLDQSVERLPALADRDHAEVLISVRNPALMSISLPKQNQVYNDILNIVQFLREQGMQDIRLLCHDHRDISFAASFTGIDYVYTGDYYTYLAMLHNCSLSLSYRLHATLPCLAYRTPVINISYDERSLSLMETVGYKDWNINMVTSTNLVETVKDHYFGLAELSKLRDQTKMRWDSLYNTIQTTFHSFANDVQSYRKNTEVEKS
jgi:polysaccharide pyruvyl transferase WcaK-like protein